MEKEELYNLFNENCYVSREFKDVKILKNSSERIYLEDINMSFDTYHQSIVKKCPICKKNSIIEEYEYYEGSGSDRDLHIKCNCFDSYNIVEIGCTILLLKKKFHKDYYKKGILTMKDIYDFLERRSKTKEE